jgi:cyclase
MKSVNRHRGAGAPMLTEVAERVFAYIQPDGSWFINNTGFVVGEQAVTAVDTCATQRRTRQLLDAIASVSSAPVTTLVNTHHHGDHTYGNFMFRPAVIIGQENCRTEILAAGFHGNSGIWEPVDWGDITVCAPDLTFCDSLRLWSDDHPIDLRWVGRAAHTTNDCVIWLPDQRVLFCGDLLFNGGTPFVLAGSVVGAVDVLSKMLADIPAETIIPGHGNPCDHRLVDTVIGYLQFVLDIAKAGIRAGVDPLTAARDTDLGEYEDWLDNERIVGNLHRAYADLDPGSGPLDLTAALSDMVTYNGGRPLACLA